MLTIRSNILKEIGASKLSKFEGNVIFDNYARELNLNPTLCRFTWLIQTN